MNHIDATIIVPSSARTYLPTSEATRGWFLRNGYKAEEIPALAKDAVPMMHAHIDAQRARRAGPPTFYQGKYLFENGWSRQQISLMTFAEASLLVRKSKKAKGLLSA